jgi:hypothetical protein
VLKDKSFNAVLKTDYDEGIGNIIIIPQDIGRVITEPRSTTPFNAG